MGWKDILVHVDRSEQCATRLDLAIGLASAHGAHLTGVFALALPYIPPYVALEIPPVVLADQEARRARDAEEAEVAFRGRAAQAGVPAEWHRAQGEPGDAVSLHARYADVAVVGQPSPEAEAPTVRDLAERLVFASGRPVLAVPYAGAFPTLGERVVVAWDGGREATRALHDALPLLERARRVTVLAVNPRDGGDGRERRIPGADIARHLARHGVSVEAAQTYGHDIEVGDILLSRLADLGADLLVMGAYGHSRVRELVLGGVTRTVLQHMTVPVLMSH